MYSFSSDTQRQDFIKSEIQRETYSFPDEIEQAYSNTYLWLLEKTDDMKTSIEKWNHGLNYYKSMPENKNVNWNGAGYEFSRLLPNHTLKAYQLFLQIQDNSEKDKEKSSLLDSPNLHIIDDGCGGGTITIGLLSMVLNYQKHRNSNRFPVFPIVINCLGLDPNLMVLDIYKKFLHECQVQLKKYSIEIKADILPKTLPDCLGDIIQWVNSQKRIHKLIVGLGNVVRPITEEYENIQRALGGFEIISKLFGSYGSNIGSREASALKALMESSDIDQLIIPIIGSDTTEPSSKTKKTKQWDEQVKSLQASITKDLDAHSIYSEKQSRLFIKVLGPQKSFYREILNRHDPRTTSYASSFTIIEHRDFLSDKDWQAILNEQNLLLAWARVRNELSYFQSDDSVEVRLFELDILERIKKLRQDIIAYKWKSLNIADMFNFYTPKGENKNPRPLNLCRLEEQILAVAMLQTKGIEMLESHPRSFAYKLSKKKSNEFLYESWYSAYSRYIDEARLYAQKHPDYLVIRTDIESYYTKIKQNTLRDDLIHEARFYDSRLRELLYVLLSRQFEWEENTGIPQGHSMSGFLSNIYLRTVDEKFGTKHIFNLEYFRYVDDIIIICDPAQKDLLIKELDNSLDKLHLSRSKEKTVEMNIDEFINNTEQDVILNWLAKEHSTVLGEVSRLDDKHYLLGRENWWQFLDKYQKLLSNLGVFISIPRLSRKINANSKSWLLRKFNLWRMVRFPYISEMKDLDETEIWIRRFTDNNGRWIDRRQSLQQYLMKIFWEGTNSLKSSSDEKEISHAQTKIRFTTYRLGQLGFGETAEEIAQILMKRPWLVNVRVVINSLAFQNREDLLIKIYLLAT